MTDPQPLRGLWVLVTRPAHQAAGVCQAIEAAGGNAIPWPVLGIEDRTDSSEVRAIAKRLHEFDLAVFVSENAAQLGIKLMRTLGYSPAVKPAFAVGEGTARCLRALGVPQPRHPRGDPGSEGLLSLLELQDRGVMGRRILIFRGEGGRELLADTLRQRGAEVEYIEVYRRARATSDPRIVSGHWERGQLDIILVSSADGLRALVEILGERERVRLFQTPLMVAGQRMAKLAAELGFRHTSLQIPDPGTSSVVKALVAWRKEHCA